MSMANEARLDLATLGGREAAGRFWSGEGLSAQAWTGRVRTPE